MEKITLAGKEYELPELNFGIVRKLGRLGFSLVDVTSISSKMADFMSACVAVITNSTLEEADKIIDASFSSGNEFAELVEKLSKWVIESDFFRKMQASKE